MEENKEDKFIPNMYFDEEVAIRFWESSAGECKGGQFNSELYKAYLRAIHQ